MMTGTIFIYGTLLAPEVLHTLLQSNPTAAVTTKYAARLWGHSRYAVRSQVFPGLIPAASIPPIKKTEMTPDSPFVDGLIVTGLSDREVKILDWFEGDEYCRTDCKCELIEEHSNDRAREKQFMDTQVYIWSNPVADLDLATPWDYDKFRSQYLSDYVKFTVQRCVDQLRTLGYYES
jgi:Gamma-glutamyl cyclotransferase, AIG2-like